MIHYPVPIHLQESYQEFSSQSHYLSVTEKIVNEIVSLPIYPEITEQEIEYIINTVLFAYKQIVG